MQKCQTKLLCVEIDRNLNFDKCVASLCKISGKNSMY